MIYILWKNFNFIQNIFFRTLRNIFYLSLAKCMAGPGIPYSCKLLVITIPSALLRTRLTTDSMAMLNEATALVTKPYNIYFYFCISPNVIYYF